MRLGKLVSFYLIRAVLPYFVLAWIILSVILFVQQAGRYSEIFFDRNLPSNFVWQLTFALIPNVIAFTCPMAVLVGVIIGLSRMQSDNELIAIRNIGIGNFAAAGPVFVLGIFLSLFSIAVNIFGVPVASRAVRLVAMRSALYKLESPIEPGVFNTEIAGFTVYVREADLELRRWKNVFVYNEDRETGKSRLITSRTGRIDSNNDNSELVLENAVVTTIDQANSAGNLATENIGELRLAIRTRRDEIVGKLNDATITVEELGLVELRRFAGSKEGREGVEAEIIMVRRVVLAFAPILFSLLGAAMVLGISRRGRGFGILLSLASLLIYFMLTFAGEQIARIGALPVVAAGLIAPAATIIAILFFAFRDNRYVGARLPSTVGQRLKKFLSKNPFRAQKYIFVDLTTGIRDLELVLSLLKFYLAAIAFLASVFMIFTAFELWRHASSFEGGTAALLRYLLYLFPFTYLQLAPTAAMIAILTVYTIKSRQNEIVVWMSAGQSIYRLVFPSLLLMLILGTVNFAIQETITPDANRLQQSLRKLIRNRGLVPKSDGRYWVATDRTIVSYKAPMTASDNEPGTVVDCARRCSVQDLMIYQFQVDRAELQSVYRIPAANWDEGRLNVTESGVAYRNAPTGFVRTELANGVIDLPRSALSGTSLSTNQMSVWEFAPRIAEADSDGERRTLQVALQRRYANLILPFVIALFTAPFAVGMGRRRRLISIVYGVGLWLVFTAVVSAFEQLGLAGTLPAGVAIWAPIMAFATIGIYLISKVRT
jgi:lipopolysaccharide export LptBFGC system permease protein LptF